MPHRTLFAGLAAPNPGESTQVLGGDFIYHNPDLTDQFLRIGALTHRHDAHTPLRDPFVPLTVTSIASAGAGLPGGTSFFFTYTLTDKQGGETLPAQIASAFTGGQVLPPSAALRATPDYTAGIMPDGQYAYAETFTDGAGGETTIGPATWTFVDPGFASAQVILTLDAPPTGAVSRRLWRSYEGADWHLVTEVSAAASSFVDAGFDPPDNPARPPQTNTTASNSVVLELQIPSSLAEAAVGSATFINIYMAEDLPTFSNPSLLQTVPAGFAGSAIIVTSFSVTAGEPPAVSTSVPGAALINPDTDILDWHWKRPVSTSTALPSGSTGDVRMTLDTGHLWGVLNPSGATDQSNWTDLLALASGAMPPDIDTAGGGLSNVYASAGNASAFVTALDFAASGEATVQLRSLGGGSAVIVISAPSASSGGGGSGGTSSPIENVNRVFTAGGTVPIPDVPSATVNDITLAGNPTFTFPAASAGKSFTIVLRQDGTAGRTVTWPGVDWLGGGGVPVLSNTASAADVAMFLCSDGATWIGAFSPGYSSSGGVGGLTSFTASAGNASATITSLLGFAASGGASVELQSLGNGSAVIMVSASGLQGPQGTQGIQGTQGPQGPAGAGVGFGGSAMSPLISPGAYAEFVPAGSASAGIAVNVVNNGGGSAQVQIGLTKQVFSALQKAQSALAQNTWTKIQFNAPDFDTAGWYDSTNHRFKPTQPGWYEITGLVGFAVHSASTQGYLVAAVKNGDSVNNLNYLGSQSITQTQVNPGALIGASRAIFLNGSTDYVEIFAYTSDTTPTTFYAVGSFSGGLLA